ncbi:MAG: hypothetical protein Q4A88_09965, partial [Clostridia bacterium]|nr:hypothetical protein [Clostridia bacterium]
VREGTAKSLRDLNLELAAKTGTVGDEFGNRDIWLAAYNREYTAVVWMGFDSNASGRSLPPDCGGGSYPAELLKRVLSKMYSGSVPPHFSIPASVVRVRLDRTTLQQTHEPVLAGILTPESDVVNEYFVQGTQPISVTAYWQIPTPPNDLTVSREGDRVVVAFSTPQEGMLYRLYREDEYGFAILRATITGSSFPARYTEAVPDVPGRYAYYVVPVHPKLQQGEALLTGRISEKSYLTVRNSANNAGKYQENG